MIVLGTSGQKQTVRTSQISNCPVLATKSTSKAHADLAVFGRTFEQHLGALPFLACYSIQPLASKLRVHVLEPILVHAFGCLGDLPRLNRFSHRERAVEPRRFRTTHVVEPKRGSRNSIGGAQHFVRLNDCSLNFVHSVNEI